MCIAIFSWLVKHLRITKTLNNYFYLLVRDLLCLENLQKDIDLLSAVHLYSSFMYASSSTELLF